MDMLMPIYDTDTGLLLHFKKEANIILESKDPNSIEYNTLRERFNVVADMLYTINTYEPTCEEDIQSIINIVNDIWNKGILSPLTLKDDEFTKYPGVDYAYNNRCGFIFKYPYGIEHKGAYKVTIKNIYDNNTNIQLNELSSEEVIFKLKENIKYNPRIYLTRAGVIVGEYIEKCFIPQKEIDKHCYSIQSVVNIPVSAIMYDDNKIILCADHRNAKITALRQFYDVPISRDKEIRDRHFNIRNYTKL